MGLLLNYSHLLFSLSIPTATVVDSSTLSIEKSEKNQNIQSATGNHNINEQGGGQQGHVGKAPSDSSSTSPTPSHINLSVNNVGIMGPAGVISPYRQQDPLATIMTTDKDYSWGWWKKKVFTWVPTGPGSLSDNSINNSHTQVILNNNNNNHNLNNSLSLSAKVLSSAPGPGNSNLSLPLNDALESVNLKAPANGQDHGEGPLNGNSNGETARENVGGPANDSISVGTVSNAEINSNSPGPNSKRGPTGIPPVSINSKDGERHFERAFRPISEREINRNPFTLMERKLYDELLAARLSRKTRAASMKVFLLVRSKMRKRAQAARAILAARNAQAAAEIKAQHNVTEVRRLSETNYFSSTEDNDQPGNQNSNPNPNPNSNNMPVKEELTDSSMVTASGHVHYPGTGTTGSPSGVTTSGTPGPQQPALSVSDSVVQTSPTSGAQGASNNQNTQAPAPIQLRLTSNNIYTFTTNDMPPPNNNLQLRDRDREYSYDDTDKESNATGVSSNAGEVNIGGAKETLRLYGNTRVAGFSEKNGNSTSTTTASGSSSVSNIPTPSSPAAKVIQPQNVVQNTTVTTPNLTQTPLASDLESLSVSATESKTIGGNTS